DFAGVGEPMILPNGESQARPGVVHRLDRDTSGVMILAKTQKAFEFLKAEFKNRQVKKTYQLIVSGEIKDDTLRVIDLPIGRSKKDPRLRVASRKAAGKLRSAKTSYRVIGHYQDFSFVEAYPETGRTHQLRAHFKSTSHPIICDSLYNPKGVCPPELNRQALHAYQLELKLPNGQKKTFTAPLPTDMTLVLDNLIPA